MMNLRRGLGPTGALLLALAVAACGTTLSRSSGGVSNGGGVSQGLASGTGSSGSGPSTSAGPAGDTSVTSAGGGTVASGSSASTGSGSGFDAGTSAGDTSVTGSPALSTNAGPGVTASTIQIGYPYSVNGAAANAAIGGAGITQGDEKGEAQTVIDDINAHGGVLGRKIVPVWHQIDAVADGNTPADTLAQAMCADFEQDHHVFAIMIGGNTILEQCAQRAGAVDVYENLSLSSTSTFQQFPSYVEVSMIDLNRAVLNEAEALAAQGYYSAWDAVNGRAATVGKAKVGIIGFDTADYHHAVDGVLRPELAQLGHAVAAQDTVYVTYPQRTSDLSTVSAQAANAILKFRQDGVEHVLIVDVTGTLTLEFLNQAESQHYHPRYGWNSQNGPQALVTPGDVPADQLIGSMGIGSAPGIDVRQSDNPDNGPYSNPSRRSCTALLAAHGFKFTDANSTTVGLLICNEFRFLKAAIESGGPSINQASFINGVNRLGSSFESATTFGTFFSPTQHDGGGGYRYYQWNTGCGCMRYTSDVKPAIGEGEH